MKLENIIKKLSFIFTMLIIALTLFCISIPVRAEETNDMQNLNITNRLYFKADGYEQSNKPDNIVDGSMQNGNGKNWYGGTKFLLEYTNLSTIYSIGVYTTENWGTSFREATIYYSEDDSLTLDSDLSNFKSVKVSTESVQTLVEPIKARRIMLVKDFGNAVYEFECFGTYTTSISTEGIKFKYTGDYQEFIVPKDGQYKIELWGASGSIHQTLAGKGAYTSGTINLKANQKLYFYVGQSLDSSTATFNGGGACGGSCSAGGGATDVRLLNGNWNDESSLASRIMVAGGGGGYNSDSTGYIGGYAGGLIGGQGAGDSKPTGGTQTSGGLSYANVVTKNGKFGIGGTGESYGGGGGGGYYGGGAGANSSTGNAGAGGSSYISGYLGSVAITSETDVTPKEGCSDGTDDIKCSYHYSNMIFSNTIMKSGNEEMPTYNASNTMIGHIGNGLAKITLVDLSKNNYLSELTTNRGTLSPSFDPSKDEYTLILSKYDSNFTLSGILSDETAVVTGLGKYNVELGETKIIEIIVTAGSGDIRTYKVNATRETLKDGEHSSKLLKLEVEGYEDGLNPEFHPLTNEYNVEISSYEIDLNVITETYDPEATAEIIGNKYIKAKTGVVTIRVSAPNVSDTVYRINYTKADFKQEYVFDYTGDYQEFIVPNDGQYKIELWGAAGGGNTTTGFGGYTSGKINLNKNQKLYVYVGNRPERTEDSFNGGGQTNNTYYPSDDGGGATDIRLEKGNMWSDFNSLKSRIMVAGGGGGYVGYGGKQGCSAGGLLGYDCGGTGGTQTSPGKGHTAYGGKDGKFGIGGNAELQYGGGAGGSGYYGGGGGGNGSSTSSGAGGSSFISGHEGCDAIDKVSTEDNIVHTGQSVHYSNLSFKDTVMIDGEGYNWTTERGEYVGQPTYNGESTQTGNNGNGYAKITSLFVGNIPNSSEDNYLTNITSDYGTLSPSFDPLNQEYTLKLDKYNMHFTLDATLSDESASVVGLGKYNIEFGKTKTVEIIVTAESGDTKIYTVNVEREKLKPGEHLSKLAKLEIKGYESGLTPEFHPSTNEYSVDIYSNEIDINLVMVPFDDEASIKVEGNRYIKEDTGIVTITVTAPGVEDTIYKINYTRLNIKDYKEEYSYEYIGDYQTFIAPIKGKYTIELWGAQGGGRTQSKGAYTKGDIILNKGQILYVYVGKGNSGGTSFNGGAGTFGGSAGGGATDIRLEKGDTWRDFNSLKSRIMVAAGSGSGDNEMNFGFGGTLEGGSGKNNTGGTQIAAGGPNNYETSGFGYADGGCTGGGGYYGGGSAACSDGAGGGSSFISGYDGADAIDESSTEDNIIHTGQSIHYSGLSFINPVMIAGNKEMPTHDGTGTMIGNGGDGYAKITLPLLLSKDNYLSQLIVDKGILTPEFDPLVNEYNVELGVDDTEIKISARPLDDLATIQGLGTHKVPGGTTTYPITVTAESGDIQVYNINITRPSSSESKPKNIIITGLVEKICNNYAEYCKLDNEFNENIHTYHMAVPSGIRELEFTVDKKHEYQSVTGEGVVKLSAEHNTIAIEITSEDGSATEKYNYEITRDMTGDNYIDKLEVVNPSIDIGFNYLIQEYAFKVDNEITELEMNVILDDPKATYEVKGNSNFVVGNNTVEIEVRAQNQELRNYILNVYRVSNSNTLLESLKVKNGEKEYTLSPEFEDIKTNYTLNVENEVEKIDIEAIAQAPNTTIVTGTGEKSLRIGLNQFKIMTTAESGDIETYTIIITREKNKNNYLKTLDIADKQINPVFNKEILDYSITVDPYIKSLNITAIPEANVSKVSISGNSNFKIGKNTVIITVTSEDGITRDYIITVTKEGSDINYLSSLSVDKGILSPVFNKEILEYRVSVGNDVTNIVLNGEKKDILSTVSGLGSYNLNTGLNTITIRVTSETGKLREYIVKVTRDYSVDATLSDLTVSSGTLSPKFNPSVTEYTVNVDSEVNNVKVNAVATSNKAIIEGVRDYKIFTGENEIIVKITAEDGLTTKEYKIKVVKDVSNNTNLSFLNVREGVLTPEFDSMKLNYEIKVPYEVEDVTVYYETDNKKASVKVEKPDILQVGENTVTINVTAEDLSEKNYTVTVIRQPMSESNLDLKTLDITSCSLNFDKDTQYYECEVENEIEKIVINAQSDNDSNIVLGTGEKVLKVGKNVLGIRVTNDLLEEKGYVVLVTRKQSAETKLNNILIDNHTLNEAFKEDKYNYTLTTKQTNLDIECIKKHEGQTISITGNSNMPLGESEIKIRVTAEDGKNTQDYVILVTREKNDNTYLSSLTIEGYDLKPIFNKGITEYNIEVENEINSIIVNAKAEHELSIVNGDGMHTLLTGENTITITVSSEDNSLRNYIIKVNKLGSRNNKLTSLEVKNHILSPAFDKNTNIYEIEDVEFSESFIEVRAKSEDDTAIITGDGKVNLVQGQNIIKVIVTAAHGEINTYEIRVRRKDPVTSKLMNIEVKNYNLDKVFEGDTLEYNVVVDNEVKSLELVITKLDPNSTFVINGNENLEIGLNEITIVSTSSDGKETTTYKLLVNRQTYSNTYLSSLIVSEGELTPSFDKTNLSYEVIVENSVDKIIVNAVPEVATTTVNGTGEHTLKVGENELRISVTSTGGITRVYNIKVIREGSNNANIKSLTSNLGQVVKLNNDSYELVVDNNVTEIRKSNFNITLEDSMAKISMKEVQNLKDSMEYIIEVTSPDGKVTKQYIVYIKHALSDDALLKSLTPSVGELLPSFDKNQNDYKIAVLDTIDEIEFIAEKNNEKSTIINNTLVFSLNEYSNTITISVQAEDGSINTYEIIVEKSLTRKKTLSNVVLKTLSKDGSEINIEQKVVFGETTYDYSLVVPYEVSNISLDIVKKHQNQKIIMYKDTEEIDVVDSYKLNVGMNTFVIEVENSYGEKQMYTYNIERLKSTNNYLSSLRLINPEYEFKDFDKEKQEYSAQIPNEYENITIEAIAEDTENATIKIQGATYLLEGNNDVSIKVTNSIGETREYIIHVLRIPKTNNLLKTLTISSGDIYELSPKFTSGITDYALEVPGIVSRIQIDAIPEEETSTVKLKLIEDDKEKVIDSNKGSFDLKVGINKIKIELVNDGVVRTYTIIITRQTGKNAYLSKLEITNGILNEKFNNERGTYTANISNDQNKLDLVLETEDEASTYEIIGNSNLRYGENEVKIKVLSADKSVAKTYVITVTKQGEEENGLKSLTIDGNLISGFNSDKEEYTLEVEHDKTSVEIGATAISKYARVSKTGYYSLDYGENTIVIEVTGQSGNIRNYIIKIIRKKSAYLKDIVVDKGVLSPEFNKEITEYSIEVDNDIKVINIMGIKEDQEATVTGNNKYSLNVLENEIILSVTSSDLKTTQDYKIIVTRKGNSNTYLKYLTITNGLLDPVFDKETMEYTAHIPNDQTTIGLDYDLEDENSTSEVIGNDNLSEKENLVTIRVTSIDGFIRDYKIKVLKDNEALFSNRLLDIKTDKGTLSPTFDPNIQEYTLTIGNKETEVQINATRENLESTVIGVGTHKLVEGRNVIQLLVTSKDNKTRIYTIIVYREESNDARLKELEFKEGYLSPAFDKNIFDYTLLVDSSAKIVSLKTIIPVENEATYELTGNTILTEGTNIINVNVTSPDRSVVKTYKITVKSEISNNAYLSSLSTNNGNFTEEFVKTKNTYTMTVDSDVSSIIVFAETESAKASIEGTGLYELNDGKNYINIIVTAENGISNIYSIIVEKKKNTNNYLREIYVRGYNFNEEYDRERLEYTLEVENDVDSVVLDASAEDENASIIGLGNKSLRTLENTFEILCVSSSGEIRTYTVIITRKKLISSKIKSLSIEEGVLNPNFNSDTYEYYISIPNEYTSLTMNIELEEEGIQPVVEGNSNFKIGKNEVYIKVTASDKSQSTYKINVTRQVSSNNYLKSLNVDKGILTPQFDKNILNYKVEVENEEDIITVSALSEANGSIVKGVGDYSLNVGLNEIILYVTSETGVTRTYKVEVTRKANTNNYLENLIVSEGSLSPAFDKDIVDYEVKVPFGTESIGIQATLESKTSTISGLGNYEISVGEKTINITVTAEDGSIKVYNIKVIRDADSNLKILNILPSEGSLTPSFSNEIEVYSMKVPSTTNIINFEVQTESKTATVSGNKDIITQVGITPVTIRVEAENKDYRDITIQVERESAVTGITVKENKIQLVKNEEYQIEWAIIPENVTEEVEYEVSDNNIIEIDSGGKIISKNTGLATAVVKVKGKEEIRAEVQVQVVNREITSGIYEIRNEEEGRIILGANEGEKIKDLIEGLDNEESLLKVYDKQNNLITDYNQIIKTGLVIKLEIKGKQYDEVIVILKGDSNEDGLIDVADRVELQNHILSRKEVTGYRKYALDVEYDNNIDVADNVKLSNYILSRIDTLN